MNTQEVLALFNREQRFDIQYPGMRKDLLPDEDRPDAVIQEQIAYFTHINQPFNWKLFDNDTPPDLKQRLLSHGLEPDDEDATNKISIGPLNLHKETHHEL